MSIAARYENGVFQPLEEVQQGEKGKMYRIFSEDELREMKDELAWLKAAEQSFEFWDNEEDDVYDQL
jgi:predicted DNA-binding antitoxin AbrB/MazE fold protein